MAQLLSTCFNCDRAYDLFYENDKGYGEDQDEFRCPGCRADFEPYREQFEEHTSGPFVVKEMREANVSNVGSTLPIPPSRDAT